MNVTQPVQIDKNLTINSSGPDPVTVRLVRNTNTTQILFDVVGSAIQFQLSQLLFFSFSSDSLLRITGSLQSLVIDRCSFADFSLDTPLPLIDVFVPDSTTSVLNQTQIVVRQTQFLRNELVLDDVPTPYSKSLVPNGSVMRISLGNSSLYNQIDFVDVQFIGSSNQAMNGIVSIDVVGPQAHTVNFERVVFDSAPFTTFASGFVYRRAAPSSELASLRFTNCTFSNNTVVRSSNGVLVLLTTGNSTIFIDRSIFSHNSCSRRDDTAEKIAAGLFVSVGSEAWHNITSTSSLSQLSVTIVDSRFDTNGCEDGQAGAVAFVTGVDALSFELYINSSAFESNYGCTDCGGAAYFGSAVQLRPLQHESDAVCTSRDPALSVLVVSNSHFANNVAVRGGAIGVRRSCPLTDGLLLRVHNSTFVSNVALGASDGYGGALSFDDNVDVKLTAVVKNEIDIVGSLFSGNGAAVAGGAVAFTRCSVFPYITSTLEFEKSTFTANEAPLGGHIFSAALMSVSLDDCNVMQGLRSTLSIGVAYSTSPPAAARANGNDTSAFFHNATVACDVGRFAAVTLQSSSMRNLKTQQLTFSCTSCVAGTYNLVGEKVAFDEAGEAIKNSFACHPCPSGSSQSCQGAMPGASPGFWSQAPATNVTEDTQLTFFQCPSHVCCDQTAGCNNADACAETRSGVLCGDCANATLTHAFAWRSACVPVELCTPTRVWLGNSLVLLACAVFVAMRWLRRDATSDGLLKSVTSFANISQIVLAESIALRIVDADDTMATVSGSMQSFFSMLSGTMLGDVLPALTFCPSPRLTSFQKLLAPIAVPVVLVLFGSIAVALSAIANRWRQRRQPEHERLLPAAEPLLSRTLKYRAFTFYLSVFDFSLFIVVGVCVNMLTSMDVPGAGCRLWRAGNVTCNDASQWAFGLLLTLVCAAPVLFDVIAKFNPASTFAAAVADVNHSAMSDNWLHLTISARRAILAFIFAFVVDAELRFVMIRTVLFAMLMLHFYCRGEIFRTLWVNRIETIAVSALLLVALLQWPAGAQPDVHRALTMVQFAILSLVGLAYVISIVVKFCKPSWLAGGSKSKVAQAAVELN